jgi:hypothetical protein
MHIHWDSEGSVHHQFSPMSDNQPRPCRRRLTCVQHLQIQVHGVRIVQLTARTTSVMTVSEVGELSAFDPVLNAFRVLGQLYNLAVSLRNPPNHIQHILTTDSDLRRSRCCPRRFVRGNSHNKSYRGIFRFTTIAMD